MFVARDVAPETLLSAAAVADLYHRSSDDIGWHHPPERKLFDCLQRLPNPHRLGFQLHHPHALVGFTPEGQYLFWVEYFDGDESLMHKVGTKRGTAYLPTFRLDTATSRQYWSLQGILQYITTHDSNPVQESTLTRENSPEVAKLSGGVDITVLTRVGLGARDIVITPVGLLDSSDADLIPFLVDVAKAGSPRAIYWNLEGSAASRDEGYRRALVRMKKKVEDFRIGFHLLGVPPWFPLDGAEPMGAFPGDAPRQSRNSM